MHLGGAIPYPRDQSAIQEPRMSIDHVFNQGSDLLAAGATLIRVLLEDVLCLQLGQPLRQQLYLFRKFKLLCLPLLLGHVLNRFTVQPHVIPSRTLPGS